MSLVASARMYAWSLSLTAAWRRLLAAIIARAGVDVSVLDEHDPTPLDELWQRRDLGCAFMCGYPWALRPDRPRVLASPVPSPPRYGGRAVYVTDFIVRHDSPYTRLEETFGKTIAYSTEHSHSGYNAPRYHLLAYRTPERPTLDALLLSRFVRVDPRELEVFLDRERAAQSAGYPKLA